MILVNFSIDGIVLTFLIDLGIDINVRTYSELATTPTSFSNLDSEEIGKTSLLLQWESFQDESTFFIAEPIELHQQAILGRAWMQKHKCSIDWDKNTISVTYNGCCMSLPLVEPNNKPLIALTSSLLPPSTPER